MIWSRTNKSPYFQEAFATERTWFSRRVSLRTHVQCLHIFVFYTPKESSPIDIWFCCLLFHFGSVKMNFLSFQNVIYTLFSLCIRSTWFYSIFSFRVSFIQRIIIERHTLIINEPQAHKLSISLSHTLKISFCVILNTRADCQFLSIYCKISAYRIAIWPILITLQSKRSRRTMISISHVSPVQSKFFY